MESPAAQVTSAGISPPSKATTTSAAKRTTFHIGTRKSALAIAQTDIATGLLRRAHPDFTFPVHSRATIGDKDQTTTLHAFNAKALWTTELEADLADHATDLIIHSLKDMPTQLPTGCELGAVCKRSEKRDCVVISQQGRERGWRTLADLPAGAVVGTSSVRRLAQLHRLHPHLRTEDVRGNVGTRLAKLDDAGGKYAALILAATGLQRLGLAERVSSYLSLAEGKWYGAVGQGAIGVEVRSGDEEVVALCQGMMVDDDDDGEGEGAVTAAAGKEAQKVYWECLAERSLLRTLEGGCSVPLGVEAGWEGPEGTELAVRALVASVDGKRVVEGEVRRRVASADEAEACGLAMAAEMVRLGAAEILAEITLNRRIIAEAGGA